MKSETYKSKTDFYRHEPRKKSLLFATELELRGEEKYFKARLPLFANTKKVSHTEIKHDLHSKVQNVAINTRYGTHLKANSIIFEPE